MIVTMTQSKHVTTCTSMRLHVTDFVWILFCALLRMQHVSSLAHRTGVLLATLCRPLSGHIRRVCCQPHHFAGLGRYHQADWCVRAVFSYCAMRELLLLGGVAAVFVMLSLASLCDRCGVLCVVRLASFVRAHVHRAEHACLSVEVGVALRAAVPTSPGFWSVSGATRWVNQPTTIQPT